MILMFKRFKLIFAEALVFMFQIKVISRMLNMFCVQLHKIKLPVIIMILMFKRFKLTFAEAYLGPSIAAIRKTPRNAAISF